MTTGGDGGRHGGMSSSPLDSTISRFRCVRFDGGLFSSSLTSVVEEDGGNGGGGGEEGGVALHQSGGETVMLTR